MKRILVTLGLMAFTAQAFGYAIEDSLSEPELKVVNGNGQFANGVYKSLAREEGNILLSPISAHACLSMLYQGTKGPTKQACANGLQITDPETAAEGYSKLIERLTSSDRATVTIANKAYVSDKNHLKTGFKNAVEEKFKSEVESADFSDPEACVNKVNTWVSEKTKGKIPQLLSEADVSPNTNIVLVNAVYFKGTWLNTFSKENTKSERFHIDENQQVDAQMMHMKKNLCSYKDDQDLDAQIVQLPYTDDDYSMVIILPKRKDGLAELEAKLVQKDLTKILDGARNEQVDIGLPKFKIEQEIDLKDPLTEVGFGEIFENSCDLTGMLEESNVRVGKVKQKTFIEVDEIGCTAAAATAISLDGALPPPPENLNFVADHPFVFLLAHHKRPSKVLNVLFYDTISTVKAIDVKKKQCRGWYKFLRNTNIHQVELGRCVIHNNTN